jgi:hypothetical protein
VSLGLQAGGRRFKAVELRLAGIVHRAISADEPVPVEIAGDVRKAKL